MGFEYSYCLNGGDRRLIEMSAGCAVSARGMYVMSSTGCLMSATTNDSTLIITTASAASGGTTLCVRNADAVFMTKSYYTTTCQVGDWLDYGSAQGLTTESNKDVQIVKVDADNSALYVRITAGEQAFD